MTYAPKHCPRCGGPLDVDVDFTEDYRDRIVYECIKCGWVASK